MLPDLTESWVYNRSGALMAVRAWLAAAAFRGAPSPRAVDASRFLDALESGGLAAAYGYLYAVCDQNPDTRERPFGLFLPHHFPAAYFYYGMHRTRAVLEVGRAWMEVSYEGPVSAHGSILSAALAAGAVTGFGGVKLKDGGKVLVGGGNVYAFLYRTPDHSAS